MDKQDRAELKESIKERKRKESLLMQWSSLALGESKMVGRLGGQKSICTVVDFPGATGKMVGGGREKEENPTIDREEEEDVGMVWNGQVSPKALANWRA